MPTPASSVARWLQIVTIALLAQGCTNSKLIIGPLYNQLDNQMRKEFNKLADFNDQQTADFEARLGTFHVWHRQAELPQYSALFQDLASSIAKPGTSQDQVSTWFTKAEAHSRAARECHPVNFSFDLMKTLTDKQLDYIENRFKRQQAKNLNRYRSRSADERVEYRLKNLEKWARRINLDFTAEQRAMLRTALVNQKSLRNEYYQLSGEWNKQLFAIARDQNNPRYDENMRKHLNKLWSLLESAYPEQWEENRSMWQTVSYRLIESMTKQQRQKTSRWVGKMARTITAISKDKPSFTPGDDPLVGCLVSDRQES